MSQKSVPPHLGRSRQSRPSLPIHSTSELPTTVFLQHLEELTAVKKTADNVTINIETLTEYDKINDPPMTIPV